MFWTSDVDLDCQDKPFRRTILSGRESTSAEICLILRDPRNSQQEDYGKWISDRVGSSDQVFLMVLSAFLPSSGCVWPAKKMTTPSKDAVSFSNLSTIASVLEAELCSSSILMASNSSK